MTPDRSDDPRPADRAAGRSAPTATYRLQLQPGFPFAAAREAVPYLASLGVSHLHLSPVLEAVPGSTHGYDVVDHTAVRGELGGEEGLRELATAARAHGLGLIADIVPNHMAVPAPEWLNQPLWQVLRDGPDSGYARWFDIDWAAQGGKVLLPVLGGPLGEELKQLRVERGTLRYHEHAFPLRPGTEGLPLPELLEPQWYRLGWWRLARTELNYRRFFTISELIAVRVEDPEVFEATHAKLLQLLREGVLDGLRVDHPDGLADPAGYLRRLAGAAGGRWTVVEKILARHEPLPVGWPVAGTTGYDALHRVDGLFLDPDGLTELTDLYRAATTPDAGHDPARGPDGDEAPGSAGPGDDTGGGWAGTVRRAAAWVVTHELAAEVERLVRTACRICAASPRLRDHAPWALRTAIRELLVRLPVYRPYAVPGAPPPEADAALLETAARGARTAFSVREEARAVDTVRDAALGRLGDGPEHRDFLARFAQTAAALRAKSVEDTAFYRFTPLLSAAEVGGDPGGPAVSAEEFHAFCARILRDWPLTGTVLSTHDTKRSADVRARLAALTECPGAWGRLFTGALAALRADGVPVPDPRLAWTAWQTALGLGSAAATAERLVPALLKAVREAGVHTSWTERNAEYEDAVAAFVADGCRGRHGVRGPAFAAFERELASPARANTLGAALLHLTMPGVPDLYMGTERTRYALVDPDNRGVPRFPAGGRAAGPGDPGGGQPADGQPGSGQPGSGQPDGRDSAGRLSDEKLRVTTAALRLRRRRPEWFGAEGSYLPVAADGPAAAHCVAFVRAGSALTAVTRLSGRLAGAGGWAGTALPLPPGHWRDLLTGRMCQRRVRLAELLTELPVALLVRE